MPRPVRLPMFALAGGLLGLIVLLAWLQYRWLGQISDAARERMSAALRTSVTSFAEDFDRELNRAYLLFQLAPFAGDDTIAGQVATRADRWQATARFPRMIKDVYVATPENGRVALQRLNASTRLLEPAAWPVPLAALHAQIDTMENRHAGSAQALVRHPAVATIWPDAPALVVSTPVVFINRVTDHSNSNAIELPTRPSYAILLLDGEYIRGEMLPALAQHYFQGSGGGFDYELAVVPTSATTPVYRSTASFNPRPDAKVDAAADLFTLRVQDFAPLAAEISRFTIMSTIGRATRGGGHAVFRETIRTPPAGTMTMPGSGPMSIIVQQKGGGVSAAVSDRLVADDARGAATRMAAASTPHWRLLVQHPSGSLELAVTRVRRRNLLVSTGILGLLAVSVAFLVISTRRAHDLARQQLEFVATVSHELRTPLAVIRSAADNLADGVVDDEARIRQYGRLVRREGVRLTELVEQILEFAGLQSGRAIARDVVTVGTVVREAAAAAQSAAEAAGVRIEMAIAEGLPAVAGDEAALRRVFVNLIGNAVKYGAATGWVWVRATAAGGRVEIAVSDRGIGIPAAEQAKIFAPFYRAPEVVAAQIQGAGLGLSLVKRIVEAHGGRIEVTSAPGEGSTFVVTLPAVSRDAAAVAGGGDVSAASDGVDQPAPQHP